LTMLLGAKPGQNVYSLGRILIHSGPVLSTKAHKIKNIKEKWGFPF